MWFLTSFLVCLLVNGILGDLPNVAKGVWLDAYTKQGARCLDGSPPLYYIRPGSSANSTKWVIHQQGGAWCTSMDDCLSRSQSRLGSSLPKYGWKPTMDFSVIPGCDTARWCGGLFVNDPTKNPLTYDWNAVFLVYCDGGSQVGTYPSPIAYLNSSISFSGYYVLNAIIDDLLQNQDDMKWVYTTMNGTAAVNPNCTEYFGKSDFQCFFAENIAFFVETPIFVVQSKYDEYQLGSILGSTTPEDVNPFGVTITSKLTTFLEQSVKSGAFIDACVHHCGGWGIGEDGDYRLVIDGDTGMNAFIQWYTGGDKKIWVQGDTYPCSECCSGGGKGQRMDLLV